MSGVSLVSSTHRSAAPGARILRASCEASFTVSLALFVASAAAIALAPGEALRAMRTAMLHFGIPLLAISMAVAALAARRIAYETDVREVHRIRERLYFVATLVLTVLVPSALFGARTVLVPRAGGAIAVHLVEAVAWLLAAWLLWGNVGDARSRAVAGESDQLDDVAPLPERSMSSIR
jgi:hypothetical protein